MAIHSPSPGNAYLYGETYLPVLKPFRLAGPDYPTFALGSPLHGVIGATLICLLTVWLSMDMALAQSTGADGAGPTIASTLLKWSPLMFFGPDGELGGFLLNVLVSVLAMAIGTFLGLWLGIGQVSQHATVRRLSWAVTQVFRNSPWLVLLFFFMLLLPFEVQILDGTYEVPGWSKATFALSLPIMANISEVVRGAISSLPTGQWESAESLAFTKHQTMWSIILPQCVKRMLPPWMNWYCILLMSTPLISILGVNDSMTLTQNVIAAEDRSEILIPLYLWLMSWFFVYSYPIAVLTRRLERRFAVKQ